MRAAALHLWEDVGKLESIESREFRSHEHADRLERRRRGRHTTNAAR